MSAALKPLRKIVSLRSVAIYGGQDIDTQLMALMSGGQCADIVVATPGRLLDLVARKNISLVRTEDFFFFFFWLFCVALVSCC